MRSRLWIITLCLLLIGNFVSAQPTVFMPLQIIYQDETGAVWLYREADGSSTPILSAESIPQNAYVNAVFSPDGFFVAITVRQVVDMFLFTEAEADKTVRELGYQNTLYVFDLITGETILGYALLPDDYRITPNDRDVMLEANFGVQWSPNGSGLVFVRGTSGPVDEYTPNGYGHVVYFNPFTQQLTDLPAIGGTPYDWQWSTNGNYAVYRGIDNFGTGAGYSSSGAVVVDMTDISAISQRELVACCTDIVPLGWIETGEFIYSHFNILAGAAGLFVYNPETDSTFTLLSESQDNLDGSAFDIHPYTGDIIVSVYDFTPTEMTLETGLYWYPSVDNTNPIRISDVVSGRTFFVDTNHIYIGERDNPQIYDIENGSLTADTVISRFVYPSGYGALFTEGTDGATLYNLDADNQFQVYPNIFPNDLLPYMRFMIVPSSVYAIAFMPHDMWGNTGSDRVYVGAIFTGETKQVSVGAGNIILDVVADFSVLQ